MAGGRAGSSKALRRAAKSFRDGDFAKAEQDCARAVEIAPFDFDALHLLGVIRGKRGMQEEALGLFDRALAIRPSQPDALTNRGSALLELGRCEDALRAYDLSLRSRPDHPSTHNKRGCALLALGRDEEALAAFGQAVVGDSDNVDYINNLGRALAALERYSEAIDCFDDAVALKPDYAAALVNAGIANSDAKNWEAALGYIDRALEIDPTNENALVRRADALHNLRRDKDALAAYDRALELRPRRPAVLAARAASLLQAERYDEGMEGCAEALAQIDALESDSLGGSNAPGEVDALRGMVLMQMGRHAEARDSYRKALIARPHIPDIEWNLGCLSLTLGDFHEGWRYYEARRRHKAAKWTKLPGPEWRGEPLAGKRILLYAEQAFGDILQFARFVSVAADLGADVSFGVPGALCAFLGAMACRPTMIPHGGAHGAFDFHAPLLSVPYILGFDEADFVDRAPYLVADPERVSLWKRRLPSHGLNVGLAWQGSGLGGRSIPLEMLQPLGAVAGVNLISLQIDDINAQLREAPPGLNITALGPNFDHGPHAFLDAAAVISSLDLIITCDTSIGHLAGGLGRPVWTLIKHDADWRWMVDRTDTPWYPKTRICRRAPRDSWRDLANEVADRLARLAAGDASALDPTAP